MSPTQLTRAVSALFGVEVGCDAATVGVTLAVDLFTFEVEFDDSGPLSLYATVLVGVVLDDPLQEFLLAIVVAVLAVVGFSWQLFLVAGDEVVLAVVLAVAADDFASAFDGEVLAL